MSQAHFVCSGANSAQERTGPVQFEKDTGDPFAIDQFLDEAKRGTKRAGTTEDDRYAGTPLPHTLTRRSTGKRIRE